jgi:hypothetical protein
MRIYRLQLIKHYGTPMYTRLLSVFQIYYENIVMVDLVLFVCIANVGSSQ